MALITDSLRTTSYTSGTNYAYVTLEYTITPQSSSSATIAWKLRCHTSYGYIAIGELSLKFNGKSVFYREPEKAASASNYELLASGTYTTEKNPIEFYVGAGIYEHKINHMASRSVEFTYESGSLNTLSFTNPVTVGQEISIGNNVTIGMDFSFGYGHKTAGTCSTITYKIGELQGTIAEYAEKSVKWTVPEQLFTMYPTTTSMSGYMYCDTYRKDFEVTPDGGYTYLGRITYPMTVLILDGPKLNPKVWDINPITLALTGDEDKLVRFFSNAQFDFQATPGAGTSLHTYKLENNPHSWFSYTVDPANVDLVINGVETGEFKFTVTDLRNYTATKTVNKDLLEYKKLTCNIYRKSATADGTIVVGVKGDYWAQNFGAKHNTLTIAYRYKAGNGEFSEWVTGPYLTDTDDYEFTITLNNLDYQTTYTFEAMVQDELMTVVSRQLPVHCLPVYDWGKDDFNLNVVLNMNNETVLRHNHTANNLVVSSSGGFIYFRPKGTDDTSAEVKINPQGNIELSGDIIINGQSLKSLLGI